jgi:hypothetical protein
MVNVITAESFVADNYAWDAGPGFDGTDPHRIPVPAAAETGSWRVCTAPGTPGPCAEFEVKPSPAPVITRRRPSSPFSARLADATRRLLLARMQIADGLRAAHGSPVCTRTA